MKSGNKFSLEKPGIQLTDLQKLGLCQAEDYGWKVIKPEESTDTVVDHYIVVIDKDANIGLLKEDGCVDPYEPPKPLTLH